MAYGYSLPLPSASDLNQQAHPGGGTRITDASREGLVEDLFEAHLRHLDVATKSAVCDRLCRVSNILDGRGLSRQAGLLDGIMMSFAAGASEQWMSDDTTQSPNQRGAADLAEARRLVAVMSDMIARVEQRDIENHAAMELYKSLGDGVSKINDLITRGDFGDAAAEARVLEQIATRSDPEKGLAEAFGGGDALWGYMWRQGFGDAKKFQAASSMLRKHLVSVAGAGTVAGQGRSKVQDAQVAEFAKRLNAMFSKYNFLDTLSEDWRDDMSPQNYKKLYSEFMQKMPNVGSLNRLTKYKARLDEGGIGADSVPTYNKNLDALQPILDEFEKNIREIEARLISGKVEPKAAIPESVSQSMNAPPPQPSVDQGATPSFDYAPPMVGGG